MIGLGKDPLLSDAVSLKLPLEVFIAIIRSISLDMYKMRCMVKQTLKSAFWNIPLCPIKFVIICTICKTYFYELVLECSANLHKIGIKLLRRVSTSLIAKNIDICKQFGCHMSINSKEVEPSLFKLL